MRLVSWNVMAGGGPRCQAIVRRLQRYDADVLVLQETVAHRATDLCHALRDGGYLHGFGSARGDSGRGTCLLSRRPIRRVADAALPHASIYPRGWLEVEVLDTGWRIAGVYGPPEGRAVPAFWNAVAAWIGCRAALPFLMIGDFNAGASHVDARDYRFKAGPAFTALTDVGLVDLWRRVNGTRRESTWFSPVGGGRGGRGFRIDHAFASPALAGRVTACRYDHRVRQRRLSDHSLLLLDIGEGN